MFSRLATELSNICIRFYLSKEMIWTGDFCSVMINLALLTINKGNTERSRRRNAFWWYSKRLPCCISMFAYPGHMRTHECMFLHLLLEFALEEQGLCAAFGRQVQKTFSPFSDRARQFSFPLSWGVRRRQPAVPSGASPLHPSLGIPETSHPANACLPTCKLAAVLFCVL